MGYCAACFRLYGKILRTFGSRICGFIYFQAYRPCSLPFSAADGGTTPVAKKQMEIDIMGEENKDTAIFGMCKRTNEKVDIQVLENFVHCSQLFRYSRTHLFLFAKPVLPEDVVKLRNKWVTSRW